MRKSERLDMKHKKWGQREIERNEEWFLTAESVRAEASTKVPEGLVLLLSVCLSETKTQIPHVYEKEKQKERERETQHSFSSPALCRRHNKRAIQGGPALKSWRVCLILVKVH